MRSLRAVSLLTLALRPCAAVLAAGLLASACAQSNAELSRVQPNVTRKADLLDGQWYFRNTVTWTPSTTGFTFAGHTGKLEKVVWEVQEKHLVAYRAYPLVPGLDPTVDPTSQVSGTTTTVCDGDGRCVGGQRYYGAPLAAYPIVSQFDIARNYNPATGEPGNVKQENSTDRPWNEREFIRVDWSASLLAKEDGYELVNPNGATDFNAWVQANEPGSDPEDWPRAEHGEDGHLSYFDFTARYLAHPDAVVDPETGESVPRCMLLGGHRYDCTAQEIRMRTSLSKVDPHRAQDYQPLVYGNDAMTKFGFFRTERLNYDRRFGVTESARIYLANRFRLFAHAYERDEAGKPDLGRPLAMAAREVEPIVYYLTPAARLGGEDAYRETLEGARDLEKAWDLAFRRAVAAAQGKPIAEVGQVLVVCENPVPERDSLTGKTPLAVCGAPGFSPRFGDLRFSFLATVADPVPNGLLGYGPLSADPETGEVISANANVYSAAVATQAQYGLDVIDLLSEEKSLDALVSGQDVKDYILRNPAYASTQARARRVQAGAQGLTSSSGPTKGAFERPTARTAALLAELRRSGLPAASSDRLGAAARVLAQSPQLQAAVVDNPDAQGDVPALLPQRVVAAGLTTSPASSSARAALLADVPRRLEAHAAQVAWASRRNITLAEFTDQPMLGLALKEERRRAARVTELKAGGNPGCGDPAACTQTEAKRLADAELLRRLRISVWRATAEHEIGHTFGLRHNFQGSFDALNYFDTYWSLRQPTLSVLQNGEPRVPRTPLDLRASAASTQSQLGAGVHDYEYSSIMDYGGKLNADFQSIGKYDAAAILFAYSGGSSPGFVEVFDAARGGTADFPGSDGKVLTLSGAARDVPLVNALRTHEGVPGFTERFHYGTAPLRFGEGASLDAALTSGIARLRQRHLMRWSEVREQTAQLSAAFARGSTPSAAQLEAAPLEVPYLFCTDEHVGAVLSCARFDRGADYLEIAQQKIEDYWNNYFFNHFKRDRYSFTSDTAFNNAATTFLDLANIYKHWVHALRGAAPGAQGFARVAYDPSMQDTWSMAVFDGINAHLSVMSVPPAGLYMYRALTTGGQWDAISEGDDFDQLTPAGQSLLQAYYGDPSRFSPPASAFAQLERGEARRMYSRYDFKSGFGFFNRLLEAGHYNDQMGAMFAAVMSDATFLGVDQTADEKRYAIPYYLVFREEMSDTFAALWTQNEQRLRPTLYLARDAKGAVSRTPRLAFRQLVDGARYLEGFDYPPKGDALCAPPQTVGCLAPEQLPGPANIQLTWTSRIYALYLGMAGFNVGYDLDYAKRNQVFKLGGEESVQPAADHHLLEVEDPDSGARYAALERNGAPPDSTPAVRMVSLAGGYAAVVNDPALCPMPPALAARGDTVCLTPAQAADAAVVAARRRAYLERLKDATRDLDLMRGFYAQYGKVF